MLSISYCKLGTLKALHTSLFFVGVGVGCQSGTKSLRVEANKELGGPRPYMAFLLYTKPEEDQMMLSIWHSP